MIFLKCFYHTCRLLWMIYAYIRNRRYWISFVSPCLMKKQKIGNCLSYSIFNKMNILFLKVKNYIRQKKPFFFLWMRGRILLWCIMNDRSQNPFMNEMLKVKALAQVQWHGIMCIALLIFVILGPPNVPVQWFWDLFQKLDLNS